MAFPLAYTNCSPPTLENRTTLRPSQLSGSVTSAKNQPYSHMPPHFVPTGQGRKGIFSASPGAGWPKVTQYAKDTAPTGVYR